MQRQTGLEAVRIELAALASQRDMWKQNYHAVADLAEDEIERADRLAEVLAGVAALCKRTEDIWPKTTVGEPYVTTREIREVLSSVCQEDVDDA